jgi:protein involved in polysaccharide export with SLBB domain
VSESRSDATAGQVHRLAGGIGHRPGDPQPQGVGARRGEEPGRYDVRSRASVLDGIALAGGFNDFARKSKIVIVRVEGSTVTRIPCDYNRVVSNGQLETCFLQPDDTLIVP